MARTKQLTRKDTRKQYSPARKSSQEKEGDKSSSVKSDKTAICSPVKKIKTERKLLAVPSTQSKIISNDWTYISSSNDGTTFNEGVADKMEDLPCDAGKWMIFVDEEFCIFAGMSHHEYVWEKIKTLVLDFRNTGIISAKCSNVGHSDDSDYTSCSKGVICCYTANYKDKQSVKVAAEAIQKAYPQSLDMYYKTENDSYLGTYSQKGNKNITKFKYSNGGKFYERGSDSRWQLIHEASETIAINYKNLPSKSFSHEWLYISSMSGNQEMMIETSDDIQDLPHTSGKWLLFHRTNSICPLVDMSHHDYAWQSLKPLVFDSKNSGIIAIKCSINQTSYNYNGGKGVICCYTENFHDKLDVKKAADAIRRIYSYPCPMYYKTEETTNSNTYSQQGDCHITIYKHTSDNEMFERDFENKGQWKPITFEN